ncbi:MAG: ISAs1 family transposase [Mariprofundaceae bacterium]|nr:ISAs1 family transposase [Mariprofundaceae bacterium]
MQQVSSLVELSGGEIIALDGKCLRRSMDKSSNLSPLYMVSAWAANNQLVLGQEKVDLKSNEITAIPKLLERLDIKGSVVTMDAMGCQTKITKQITDNGADYMINLKGNQGNLHKDVKDFFESDKTSPPVSHETFDAGHGRFETRTIRATSDIGWLQNEHPKWAKLTSIVAVTSKRELKTKTTEDTRYFISSLDATNPEKLGFVARAHWGIENRLHWVLDYAFDEDSQRTRAGNSAANMAIIRHLALNLLKSEETAREGMKTKRLKAGWDDDYMLKVLAKSACF